MLHPVKHQAWHTATARGIAVMFCAKFVAVTKAFAKTTTIKWKWTTP